MTATKSVHRPILVTGCPRSGTTFVGKVIGEAPGAFYVYEPFNDDVGAHLRFPERFIELTDANAPPYARHLDQLVSLGHLPTRMGLALRGTGERWMPAQSRNVSGRLAARRLLRHRKDFIRPHRVCIKDPVAFFSAPWIAERYDADVIVLVRHPCGVVSSYLELNWASELDAILDRSLPDHAGALRDEIEDYRQGPRDLVGDLILQWKIFTTITLDWQSRFPRWTFIVHDRLCETPHEHFDAVFDRIGLRFTDRARASIAKRNGKTDATDERLARQHDHNRDSRAIVGAWRGKLKPDVAGRVLEATEDLWQATCETIGPLERQ
ncbi:MAG: sulfotransferase [Pseudomonadota bacterium]